MKLTKKQDFLCEKLKDENPKEIIIEYIRKFNEDFELDEAAVKKVFDEKVLDYSSIENILIKVIVLNNRYRTRLNDSQTNKKGIMPNVMQVAECLFEYEQQGVFSSCRDKKKLIDLVEDFRKKFEEYNEPYSFITKYCSFRLPEIEVPIVDGYVKGILYYYQFKDKIDNVYTQPQFGSYEKFYDAYDLFIERHQLKQLEYESKKLTIKDIDKYLWLFAKEKETEWNKEYEDYIKKEDKNRKSDIIFSIAI